MRKNTSERCISARASVSPLSMSLSTSETWSAGFEVMRWWEIWWFSAHTNLSLEHASPQLMPKWGSCRVQLQLYRHCCWCCRDVWAISSPVHVFAMKTSHPSSCKSPLRVQGCRECPMKLSHPRRATSVAPRRSLICRIDSSTNSPTRHWIWSFPRLCSRSSWKIHCHSPAGSLRCTRMWKSCRYRQKYSFFTD